jgi:2-keto-4-pentenoate hydratase
MPRLTAAAARQAALLVAEAVGDADAPLVLPEACRPTTVAAGRRIAALALEQLGLVSVGLRLAPGFDGAGMIAGPLIEGRLLRSPAAVPPPGPGRRRCTLAVAAQLSAALSPRARPWRAREVAARIASLHVAIDLAETRFAEGPPDLPQHVADLAGLGLVVFGPPARAGWQEAILKPLAASVGPDAWRGAVDVGAALVAAAEEACAAGGLPAGALLVVAGLSPAVADVPVTARITRLGTAERLAVPER